MAILNANIMRAIAPRFSGEYGSRQAKIIDAVGRPSWVCPVVRKPARKERVRECARDPRYNVSDKNVMDAAHSSSLPLPLPLPQTYAPCPVWSDSTTAPIRFASDAEEGRGAPRAAVGVTSTASQSGLPGRSKPARKERVRERARDPEQNVSDKNVMDAAHSSSLPLPLPLPQTYAPCPVWSTAPLPQSASPRCRRRPWCASGTVGVTSTAARTSMAGMVALSAPAALQGHCHLNVGVWAARRLDARSHAVW